MGKQIYFKKSCDTVRYVQDTSIMFKKAVFARMPSRFLYIVQHVQIREENVGRSTFSLASKD
jgi:hypothetical protein